MTLPLRHQLARVAEKFAAHTGLSLATVSRKATGNSNRVHLIVAGKGDMCSANIEAAIQWLSDNWPAAAEWPGGIERPTPQAQAQGDAA